MPGAGMLERRLAALLLAASTLFVTAGATELVVTQAAGEAVSAQRRLGLLDRLQGGDRLELAAGATLVLFDLEGGRQFTLTGPARFSIAAAGPERQGGSGSARVDLPDPALARALRRPGQAAAGAILRSGAADGGVEVLAPSQALLSWRARPHRGHWTLRLRDASGGLLYETSLAGTEHVLPDTLRLAHGARYLRELEWEQRDGSRGTELLALETLDAAADAELAALRPPPGAAPAARVLYALYLRARGLHGLAQRAAPELAEGN